MGLRCLFRFGMPAPNQNKANKTKEITFLNAIYSWQRNPVSEKKQRIAIQNVCSKWDSTAV